MTGGPDRGAAGRSLATRLGKSDAELAARILNGMPTPGAPVAMPARGGNAALTAADAKAWIAYLRTPGNSCARPCFLPGVFP